VKNFLLLCAGVFLLAAAWWLVGPDLGTSAGTYKMFQGQRSIIGGETLTIYLYNTRTGEIWVRGPSGTLPLWYKEKGD